MIITHLKTDYCKNPHTNTDNVLIIKFHNLSIHSSFNKINTFDKTNYLEIKVAAEKHCVNSMRTKL